MAANKTVSNIAVALAAAASTPVLRTAVQPLPTPPNSLSPTLPPHKVHYGDAMPASYHPVIRIDSDEELRVADLEETGKSRVGTSLPQEQRLPLTSDALSALSQGPGAIKSDMLAQKYLPAIMMVQKHGDLAVRHIMGYLTQIVPGFARIPPAKARRLVVAALESKEGGGKHGEIVFVKTGWGRWAARYRGQPGALATAAAPGGRPAAFSPPLSVPGSYALSNAGDFQIPRVRPAKRRDSTSGSGTGSGSVGDARRGGLWAEHEADKMSLDGSSPPGLYDEVYDHVDESDSETEDEDWASIGFEALKAASMSAPRSSNTCAPRVGSYGASRTVPLAVPARPQGWGDNRHVASVSGSHSYVSRAGSRNPSRRGSSSYPYPSLNQMSGSVDQRMRAVTYPSGIAASTAAGHHKSGGLGSALKQIPNTKMTEADAPAPAGASKPQGEVERDRDAAEVLMLLGLKAV